MHDKRQPIPAYQRGYTRLDRQLNQMRSVATLGRASRFYDVTNSKEYEVESGPLTSDECLRV